MLSLAEDIILGCPGLPLCKRLTEPYGGQIRVESHVGKGPTFDFSLPLEAPGWH
ncbi:HAMP domain-containing histidine kinase [candidate division TA06 bacterium]|uniref:HAMP domain-containing histidine kinase n=1 Tax=candidate division TA06 bacterium TaxID=2250710 RepID=A0A523XH68_UNCT6|nr:MAG: HAMP domain-containing histidine kinase [candidate division TA06 bacterium]